MTVIPIRGTQPYQSRPGRFAVVADDLGSLRGPVTGVVELPHRMLWRPDRTVDLDQPWQLRSMYETVLVEAVRLDELCDWLDGATLLRLWDELYLPRGVRRSWQERHPVLGGLRAAA